jgi:hypothetical protein
MIADRKRKRQGEKKGVEKNPNQQTATKNDSFSHKDTRLHILAAL